MKKLLFSLLFLFSVLVSTQSIAQLSVGKGTKFANLGIGVGGYGGIIYGAGVAFGASFEAGVADNITVGGIGSFRPYSGVGSYYSLGARGSYHFNELLNVANDKVDLYAGLGLVYSGFTYKSDYAAFRYSYGGVNVGAHLGGRYFFSNNLGGFAELGYGVSPLQLGLTLKL